MEGMPVPTEGGEHHNVRLRDRSPPGNNLVAYLKIFKVPHWTSPEINSKHEAPNPKQLPMADCATSER
jgi:hypothetical protein